MHTYMPYAAADFDGFVLDTAHRPARCYAIPNILPYLYCIESVSQRIEMRCVSEPSIRQGPDTRDTQRYVRDTLWGKHTPIHGENAAVPTLDHAHNYARDRLP